MAKNRENRDFFTQFCKNKDIGSKNRVPPIERKILLHFGPLFFGVPGKTVKWRQSVWPKIGPGPTLSGPSGGGGSVGAKGVGNWKWKIFHWFFFLSPKALEEKFLLPPGDRKWLSDLARVERNPRGSVSNALVRKNVWLLKPQSGCLKTFFFFFVKIIPKPTEWQQKAATMPCTQGSKLTLVHRHVHFGDLETSFIGKNICC